MIIEIPAGAPGTAESNNRRQIDLVLVDNSAAITLVGRRHREGAHQGSVLPWNDCSVCAEIGRRANQIARVEMGRYWRNLNSG